MPSLIQKTANYVRSRLENEKTGHDWSHIKRVWDIAKFLQKQEGGDLELVELAALLHSISEQDYKRTTTDDKLRSIAMWGILDILELDEDLKHKIITIGEECRFRGTETVVPSTIEGKIVQDANWLDGVGAIGIARVFTAGGYMGRRIHDPDDKPAPHTVNSAFQKRKQYGTSLNYFLEKTLQIVPRLNTATAKKIVIARQAYLKDFIEKFMQEWGGGDYLAVAPLSKQS